MKKYDKIIGIFSLNHIDFLNWLSENNIDYSNTFKYKNNVILYNNILYIGLIHPRDTYSISFDDFFITSMGKENPLYNEILYFFKPCLRQYYADKEKLKLL